MGNLLMYLLEILLEVKDHLGCITREDIIKGVEGLEVRGNQHLLHQLFKETLKDSNWREDN